MKSLRIPTNKMSVGGEARTPIDTYVDSWLFGRGEAVFAYNMARSIGKDLDDVPIADRAQDAVRTAMRLVEHSYGVLNEDIATAALIGRLVSTITGENYDN